MPEHIAINEQNPRRSLLSIESYLRAPELQQYLGEGGSTLRETISQHAALGCKIPVLTFTVQSVSISTPHCAECFA